MLCSGETVRCRVCGAIMRIVDENNLICDECGNDGWLDEEDPDYPGEPMQRAGNMPRATVAIDGTWTSWDN